MKRLMKKRLNKTMKHILLLGFLSYQVAIANPKRTECSSAESFLDSGQVSSFLAQRIDRKQRAIFNSRDGDSHGMDSDTLISFEKDGQVILGEHGYTYTGYTGTYSIDGDGIISLSLNAYPSEWPEMKLSSDGVNYRLHTVSGNSAFLMGGRAGAVEAEGMKSFWPFRLVQKSTKPSISVVRVFEQLRYFESPVLPDAFAWKGCSEWKDGSVRFRLSLTINTNGSVKVEGHRAWGHEIEAFSNDDWRYQIVETATDAVENWKYVPQLVDGKPRKASVDYRFKVSEVEGVVRWVIKGAHGTVFDNMPREKIKEDLRTLRQ